MTRERSNVQGSSAVVVGDVELARLLTCTPTHQRTNIHTHARLRSRFVSNVASFAPALSHSLPRGEEREEGRVARARQRLRGELRTQSLGDGLERAGLDNGMQSRHRRPRHNVLPRLFLAGLLGRSDRSHAGGVQLQCACRWVGVGRVARGAWAREREERTQARAVCGGSASPRKRPRLRLHARDEAAARADGGWVRSQEAMGWVGAGSEAESENERASARCHRYNSSRAHVSHSLAMAGGGGGAEQRRSNERTRGRGRTRARRTPPARASHISLCASLARSPPLLARSLRTANRIGACTRVPLRFTNVKDRAPGLRPGTLLFRFFASSLLRSFARLLCLREAPS